MIFILQFDRDYLSMPCLNYLLNHPLLTSGITVCSFLLPLLDLWYRLSPRIHLPLFNLISSQKPSLLTQQHLDQHVAMALISPPLLCSLSYLSIFPYLGSAALLVNTASFQKSGCLLRWQQRCTNMPSKVQDKKIKSVLNKRLGSFWNHFPKEAVVMLLITVQFRIMGETVSIAIVIVEVSGTIDLKF